MPKGRILNLFSDRYQVAVGEKLYNCIARGKWKKEQIFPTVGDIVEITITDENKNEGVMEEIYPRTNTLKRPKISNLTQIIFVVSMNMPKPDLLLLDKQLAFAMWKKIKPVICLNKVDLANSEEVLKISNIYKNAGYIVIQTNAKGKENIEDIKSILKNNITAFAGNSGVGKSTLINDIFEQNITEEGDISSKNKRGKNTTTSVTLYEIEPNSYVADTPGFSTFSIEEIESTHLAEYFKEFKKHIPYCEFVGCSHKSEENCGIKKALLSGEISSKRYENYCQIYEELKKMEEHKW